MTVKQCETYERQYKEMRPLYDMQRVEAQSLRKEMLALSATCDTLRSELMETKTKITVNRETKKAKQIRPSEFVMTDDGELTEETEKELLVVVLNSIIPALSEGEAIII